jgi:hypothetical protein
MLIKKVLAPKRKTSFANLGRITSFEQLEITFESALFDDLHK